MQDIFHPEQPCNACLRRAGMNEKHFSICSGCKMAIYCSSTCQKGDWKTHRMQGQAGVPCIHLTHGFGTPKKTHSPDSQPSLGERRRVLSQFFLMHRSSIRKAVESAVFLKSGVENFDLKSYCMIVNLLWRKTTDGNPSMAFHVVAADLRPMDEVKSKRHYKQTLDASEATQDAYDAGKRKLPSEKGFVGTLMAIYEMEGFFIAKGEEVWENVSFFHKNEIWEQELQMTVETGVVFQPNGRGGDPWTNAGRYRLVKSKWH